MRRKWWEGGWIAKIEWWKWWHAALIAQEGAKMLLQMPNRLRLVSNQFVHLPLLFILLGLPHGPLLLSLNPLPLSLLLAVNKPLKIYNTLLNGLYLSREMMDVITYTTVSFSKTWDLQLEGGEGLEESRVKRHVPRRRRPAGLNRGWWVKWGWWWRDGLIINVSALGLGSLLTLITILIILIVLSLLISS